MSKENLTLLERALKNPGHRNTKDATQEELDLVRAWLDDKISFKQVQRVIDESPTRTYVFLANTCKEIYKSLIKPNKSPNVGTHKTPR